MRHVSGTRRGFESLLKRCLLSLFLFMNWVALVVVADFKVILPRRSDNVPFFLPCPSSFWKRAVFPIETWGIISYFEPFESTVRCLQCFSPSFLFEPWFFPAL